MIEDKIIEAQIVKDETNIDKYNIDAVTAFMKTLFADMGEMYKRSSISQAKVLLGLVFPPDWLGTIYNGTLDFKISLIYQYIRGRGIIPLGDPVAFSFEHFMNWIEYLRLSFYQNVNKAIN